MKETIAIYREHIGHMGAYVSCLIYFSFLMKLLKLLLNSILSTFFFSISVIEFFSRMQIKPKLNYEGFIQTVVNTFQKWGLRDGFMSSSSF